VSQFDDQDVYEQVEIVVSDNASTDNTEEVVKEYQKKFDNIKYLKINQGVSGGLNWDNAIINSTGKYINTMGDDDIYLPGSLKKILSVFSTEDDFGVMAVTHVPFTNKNIEFPDEYTGKFKKIPAEELAKNFFSINDKAVMEKNIQLGPCFMFFKGDVAREMKKTTGYFWKDPICDHWAIFGSLHSQDFLVFYDCPIVAYRVHPGNHLLIKYKKEVIGKLLENFLTKYNKNFNLFPGTSFTNLIYLGMQDIQHHFPGYKKFPINTDKLLTVHINDVFHSDFPFLEKTKYMVESFLLIKKNKFVYGLNFLFAGLKFFVKRIIKVGLNGIRRIILPEKQK